MEDGRSYSVEGSPEDEKPSVSPERRESLGGEPPVKKLKRARNVCARCRSRKQRCDGVSIPCLRCREAGKPCSFETDPHALLRVTPRDQQGIASSSAAAGNGEQSGATIDTGVAGMTVQDMANELLEHRHRIVQLEAAVSALHGAGIIQQASGAMSTATSHQRLVTASSSNSASSTPTSAPSGTFLPRRQNSGPPPPPPAPPPPTASTSQPIITSTSSAPTPGKIASMDSVRLGAPIQTLRNLNVHGPGNGTDAVPSPSLPPYRPPDRSESHLDPVWSGTISVQEAQSFFDIYFTHCHTMAPFMCIETQTNCGQVRSASLFLFTCLCVVGARYWTDPTARPGTGETRLHPRYFDLVALFDRQVSSLFLFPTPPDICLETVQGLLLSAQWMALDRPVNPDARPHSRFNDASAWNMIGLAIRFATFLQLERDIDKPFTGHGSASDQEIRRMRVWLNLISVDHHLRLTASLPASLDPTSAARVSRVYASHPRAQSTDIKFAGLCELIMIVHRAALASGDPSLRNLDQTTLRKANEELNQWEGVWTAVLAGNIESFRTQLPFTALRWYRLAINSIALQGQWSQRLAESVQVPPALAISIDAAANLLFHFSEEAVHYSGRLYEIPSYSPFTPHRQLVASFRYSVDSYCVTATFAAVYLVLAYDRGAIDYNLRLREWTSVRPPPPPPEQSVIYRLLRLINEVFYTVCSSAPEHPAGHYQDILASTLGALMRPVKDGQDVEELFTALMGDGGFDWSMGLFPTTA
ncbi:hypothetical protein T439DRAFT_110046 [Meredithblackwellia eburnea MCA 4105]